MANNKRRKNIFNSLTTLFFAIAVALLGVLVLGLENYQPNQSTSIQHNTLQLNQEYVSNPYVVVGDKVYTYAELIASQADSPSSQMSAGGGYKIWFDESNKLELVFYQEISTITQSVVNNSNLSTIALEDSKIASKLQAVKNDDGSIDITIIDPTDIVYISTSGDAEYTLYGLAFGTNTVLNYDDGFYIGEKRSPISFSAVSTIKEAQLLKISRGNFSFNGEKTYKPNSQQEGRAFWVINGSLTLNQITLDGFGCSDENYNGGAVYIETGTLNLNCNIKNCYATNGGAVAMDDGTLAINGGEYSSNTATDNGGAFYYLDENKLTISDGTFSGNSATYGGVVYAKTHVTVSDGTFNGNSATMGGVVYGTSEKVETSDITNITDGAIRFNRTLTKPNFTSVDVEFTLFLFGNMYTGNAISVVEENGITSLALSLVDDDETNIIAPYIFSNDTGWISDGDTDFYDYYSTIRITKDPNNSEFTSWIKANAKLSNTNVTINGGTFVGNSYRSDDSSWSSAGSVVFVDGHTIINGGSFSGYMAGLGVFYSTGNTTISSGETATAFEQNYGLVALVYTWGNLTISGEATLPKFTGNDSDAGVFRIGGDLTINNGEFISNGAGGGLGTSGSVFNISGNTIVYDGVFDDNGGEDSVIECAGDVTIYGGQFINSHSCAYGTESAHVSGDGAVILSKGTITILGGEFSNNNTGSGGKGGVVKTVDNGDVVISGGTFSGNGANMGGVIYTQNGNITISAGTFSGNYASIATHMYSEDTEPGFGGVIYSVGGNVTITGGTFNNNSANFSSGNNGGYGGVVYAETGVVNISGIEFSSNVANNGGVVYTKGELTLTNCTFRGNGATTYGGVAYAEGLLTISNCTFDQNGAEYGAVAYTTNALTLSDCVFENNEAGTDGIVYCADSDSVVSISNSTLRDNIANNTNGAIIWIAGLETSTIDARRAVNFTNCLFEYNYAAVIESYYSNLTIMDCSFLFGGVGVKAEESTVKIENSNINESDNIVDTNTILGTWKLNYILDLSIARTFNINIKINQLISLFLTLFADESCDIFTKLGIGSEDRDSNVGLWFGYGKNSETKCIWDENGYIDDPNEATAAFQTFTIIGGEDSNDADLLAWLQANATKLSDIVKDENGYTPNVFLGNGMSVFVEGGSLEMVGQTFINNGADAGIGYLSSNDEERQCIVSKCNFLSEGVNGFCKTALLIDNADCQISDCTFKYCNGNINSNFTRSSDMFGVITADESSMLVMNNCTFANNVGMLCLASNMEIADCIFKNNTSKWGDYELDGQTLILSAELNNTNCVFENNTATASVIVVESDITISGGTFTNNVGGIGGVVYSADGGNVTISGGTFSGNSSNYNADLSSDTGRGGVIYSEGSGTVTISGGTFENNSSLCGGVVYSEGDVVIENGTFTNNSATVGGVVYSAGDVTISGGTFSGNSATYSSSSDEDAGNGGVVYADVVNISDGEFTQNTGLRGGVAYVTTASTISGGTFSNNQAMCGGVVYGDCNYGDITDITDGQIKLNQTLTKPTFTSIDVEFEIEVLGIEVYYGSKIFVIEENGGSYLSIKFSADGNSYEQKIYTFTDSDGNSVNDWEEWCYDLYSTIKIVSDPASEEFTTWIKTNAKKMIGTEFIFNGGTFFRNSANQGGVACSEYNQQLIITDGNFNNNINEQFDESTYSLSGGVFYIFSGDIYIENGTFADNQSNGNGGLLYFIGKTLTISNGLFVGNKNLYGDYGGLIFAGCEETTISGGTFTNNSANRYGGVLCGGGAVKVSGGTYTNNYASCGGVFNSSNIEICGGTFTGNHASYEGGIVYTYEGTITISGGIFENNYTGRENGRSVSCGGVAFADDGKVIISNGEFNDNSAEGEIYGKGGVVYAKNVEISGGTFTGNSATYGSVVYISNRENRTPSLNISGGIFDNNQSTYGTICTIDSDYCSETRDVTISGGTFTNNTGYAIYAQNGLTLGGATFEGNETDIYLGESGYISLTNALDSTLVVYKNGITNIDDSDVATGYIAYSTNRQILESAEEYITVSNIVDGCELDIDTIENYLVCVTKEIYGIYDISTGKLVHKWRKMVKTGDVSLSEGTLVLVNKSYAGRMVVSPVVTTIGTGAFVDSMLSEIYLPNSVETIQDYAFSTSNSVINNLEVLKIGGNISSIGNMNLPSLTTLYLADLTAWCEATKGSIYLPISTLYVGEILVSDLVIPANTTSIYSQSFSGMNAITSVSIPASITQIGALAFDQTLNNTSFVVDSDNENYTSNNGVLFDKTLTTLIAYPLAKGSNYTLPTQTTTIAENAFALAKNVTGLTFNNALATIEEYAFLGLNYLEGSAINISLPNSLTSLGQGAFVYAKIADVTLGTGLETIPNEAFALSTITSINLNNVTAIEEYAFCGCSSLGGTLEIANNCTIEKCAFMDCSALEKVVFAGDISQINSQTFSGCSNIVEYNFKNCTGVPTLANVDAFEGINDNCKIYVPSSLYILWLLHINWQDYAEYIVKPVTTITFDANSGTLNHAQTMQVEFGSALALPTLTDSSKTAVYKEGYILLGYTYINNIESEESLTSSMLFDSNGQPVASVRGYTDDSGQWYCTDEELTLYAIWQRANAYLLKDWKTVLAGVESLSDKDLVSIAFVNEIPEGYTYVTSLGATDKTGKTAYSFTLDSADVEAYVDTSSDSEYNLILYSNVTIYAPEDSSYLFAFAKVEDNQVNEIYFENWTVTSISLDNFNTSNVTNMRGMFSCNTYLDSALDLSNFDTSKVTDMAYMFFYCEELPSLDVSTFDTSKVTDMAGMFAACTTISSLDLTNFSTGNVTDMNSMFAMVYSIEGDAIGSLFGASLSSIIWGAGFDTSKVTNMAGMFQCLVNVTSLNLATFNTQNVTSMSNMFSLCGITEIDLSGFNTSKVTDMSWMFGWTAFSELDLSGFDTSNVENMNSMFYNTNLPDAPLDLTSFNTSNVIDMGEMFSYCGVTTILFGDNFDTSKVTDMSSMFYNSSIKSLDLSVFNTSNVTNMRYMFEYCDELETIIFGKKFNTSKVTNMCGMFYDCRKLTSLDLSGFNTSNVTNMGSMFKECVALVSVNLSSFDTSKVTTLREMFYNCGSLVELDLSNFVTTSIVWGSPDPGLWNMFSNCGSLEILNISNFTISTANADSTYTYPIFNSYTKSLKTLYAPKEIADGVEMELPVTPMYYFDGSNVASASTLTSTQAGKTLYSTYGTVTFVVSGGSSSSESKKVLLGEKYGTLPSISVNSALGYTVSIDGWYTASTGGTKVTASTIVSTAGDHTLYARYTTTENSYTISYELGGGTSGAKAPTGANYTTVVQISNPTRNGYTFAGWTITGVDGTYAKYGNSSSSITTTLEDGATGITAQYFRYLTSVSGGTVTFTATWTAEAKTINYQMYIDYAHLYYLSMYVDDVLVTGSSITVTDTTTITLKAENIKGSYMSDSYGLQVTYPDGTTSTHGSPSGVSGRTNSTVTITGDKLLSGSGNFIIKSYSGSTYATKKVVNNHIKYNLYRPAGGTLEWINDSDTATQNTRLYVNVGTSDSNTEILGYISSEGTLSGNVSLIDGASLYVSAKYVYCSSTYLNNLAEFYGFVVSSSTSSSNFVELYGDDSKHFQYEKYAENWYNTNNMQISPYDGYKTSQTLNIYPGIKNGSWDYWNGSNISNVLITDSGTTTGEESNTPSSGESEVSVKVYLYNESNSGLIYSSANSSKTGKYLYYVGVFTVGRISDLYLYLLDVKSNMNLQTTDACYHYSSTELKAQQITILDSSGNNITYNGNNDSEGGFSGWVDGGTATITISYATSATSLSNIGIDKADIQGSSGVEFSSITLDDSGVVTSTTQVWLDDKFRKLQQKQDTAVDFDGVKLDT